MKLKELESTERDEGAIFNEMVEIVGRGMKPVCGRFLRAQHAKPTGCVSAKFQIADHVPAHLRHGVFSEPKRTFDAIVRFSNAQGTVEKDSDPTGRGLAIKLLDVRGERAMRDDPDTSQDFVMVNHPTFPFRTPRAYINFMRRVVDKGQSQLRALLCSGLKAFWIAVIVIARKKVGSPLKIRYWSMTPYWLGTADGESGHAVKYSVVPHRFDPKARPIVPKDPPENYSYLTQALERELSGQDAVFDFTVQLQKDPAAMPVEDVSVEWDERISKPITVAKLTIRKGEKVGVSGATCESMSFSPWHARKEHLPLGGMNRLRQEVYKSSFAKRTGKPVISGSAASRSHYPAGVA